MEAKSSTASPFEPKVMADATEPAVQAASQGLEAVKDITFGSIAGIIGKSVEYPFDTVKVRLQSQPDHLPLRYTGPLDCFKQSIAQDGFRSLYRGISAPLVGAAAENASLFLAYRVAQDILKMTVMSHHTEDKLPLGGLITAGAMSGGITSLVLTPIELVKCRMQVPLQSSLDPGLGPHLALATKPLGPVAVMSEIYRREGLKGFWRGQFGTLLRETGGGAAWFGSYETLSLCFKKQLEDPKTGSISVWHSMVSGGIAGMAYNFIFFPADTIKSKIQTGELTNVRPAFTAVGKELYAVHGLKGLYRGCGLTVARSAPSSALIFTIYEGLKQTVECVPD